MPKVHDFDTFPQETPAWCWAAASQMMLRRFLGTSVQQCELASAYAELNYGVHLDCCKNGSDARCQQYGPLLMRGLRSDAPGPNQYMSWNQVKTEIDNNRPFIISSSIHYYVCVGYNDNASQELLLWNPWPAGQGAWETKTMAWYLNLQDSQSYYNFRPA